MNTTNEKLSQMIDVICKKKLIIKEEQGDSGLFLCYNEKRTLRGLFADIGDGYMFNVSGWEKLPAPPKILKEIGNCQLSLSGDRYVMVNTLTGESHDISARPDITSQSRLEAHWRSFLDVQLDGLRLGGFNYAQLRDAVLKAKQVEIDAGADFCESGFQVVMIDRDGERIGGGPIGYHDGNPSLSLIRSYFKGLPDAVGMSIENQSRVYGEGNAIERRWSEPPFGWWFVMIYPADATTLDLET